MGNYKFIIVDAEEYGEISDVMDNWKDAYERYLEAKKFDKQYHIGMGALIRREEKYINDNGKEITIHTYFKPRKYKTSIKFKVIDKEVWE